MPQLIDLAELKSELKIDPRNPREDKNLNWYVEMVTDIIEEWLDRKDALFYKVGRVEYPRSTGTEYLILRARPVYSVPQPIVVIDEGGEWGQATGSFDNDPLVYGEAYSLKIEREEEPKNRSGLLVRHNGVWPLPAARAQGYLSPFASTAQGTIKVTYTAGYTVDELPARFRTAIMLGVARLRNIMPLGQELGSESYLDRGVSYVTGYRNIILSVVKPFIGSSRNWHW